MFRNVHETTPSALAQSIYTVRSDQGHTELRACTVGKDSKNGSAYIYATGGTKGRLFRNASTGTQSGLSEVILIRLDSSGNFLRGSQLPFSNRSALGVSVKMDQDRYELVVAVNFETSGGQAGGTMLYRFNPLDLSQLSNPLQVNDFGGNPYVAAQSLSISPKFTAITETSAVYIAGSALINPTHGNDIFCHIFTKVGAQQDAVAVYVDGYGSTKLNDYGTSVTAGDDGNAYLTGYSVSTSAGVSSEFPILVVVSPVGQVLFRTMKNTSIGVGERINQAAIVQNIAGGAKLVYVGRVGQVGGNGSLNVATVGLLEISSGTVPIFDGFGPVTAAGSQSTPGTTSSDSQSNGPSALLIGLAGGISGIVVIVSVIVIGTIALNGRRHSPWSPTSSAPVSRKSEGVRARAHMENQDDI